VGSAASLKSKDLFPAVFSRHAAAYQSRLEMVMARGEALGRMRVIELLDAQPGMRVLDLACGPGTLTRRLAKLVSPGGEVVGVDLAPGMIELGRAAGITNARFEVMDIEHLLFTDSSFDAAACGHGIQFVPELAVTLREVRRVLRPRAPFAASVPLQGIAEPVWSLLDKVADRRLPPAPRAIDQKRTRDTVNDPTAFGRAALEAGFTTAEVEEVEEKVHWESAEQLVSLFASWWDCSTRMEGVDEDERRRFVEEATATLQAAYPGAIETTGRNHVLLAVA
jgi:ubiquinone/menaquinone biosynthesis C-methylase UbiE